MRTTTPKVEQQIAIDMPVTAPGYFVEIAFDSPLRFSSRGDISWGGNFWMAWDVKLSGLTVDSASSSNDGQLTLGNSDFALGVVILAEGVVGRAVNIWKFYGETPLEDDPVLIFSGVGGEANIDPTAGTVSLKLEQSGGRASFSPRRYITAEQGFSFLPPAGLVINWNGEQFILEAGQNA